MGRIPFDEKHCVRIIVNVITRGAVQIGLEELRTLA